MNGGGDHCLATEYNETPQQLALRYGNTDCAQFLSCVGQCNSRALDCAATVLLQWMLYFV